MTVAAIAPGSEPGALAATVTAVTSAARITRGNGAIPRRVRRL